MIYTYLRYLPGYCHEFVTPNEDGSYTIIINAALCREQQMEAYAHALQHIAEGHFEARTNADAIEAASHMPV